MEEPSVPRENVEMVPVRVYVSWCGPPEVEVSVTYNLLLATSRSNYLDK
jgi:hypothetical protein